jgi:hypothetical protein
MITDVPVPKAPSMAQTHFQGPLAINGSGKSLSRYEKLAVKEELEPIKAEFGLKEPVGSSWSFDREGLLPPSQSN